MADEFNSDRQKKLSENTNDFNTKRRKLSKIKVSLTAVLICFVPLFGSSLNVEAFTTSGIYGAILSQQKYDQPFCQGQNPNLIIKKHQHELPPFRHMLSASSGVMKGKCRILPSTSLLISTSAHAEDPNPSLSEYEINVEKSGHSDASESHADHKLHSNYDISMGDKKNIVLHSDESSQASSSLSVSSLDDGVEVFEPSMKDYAGISAVVSAFIFFSLYIIKLSGPGSWRYYLAGGICASTSHAMTTPIDVVKTRLQVDPSMKEKGMIKAAGSMIKKEGLQVLLAGLGPTTFGYLIEGAAKFGIYEVLKQFMFQYNFAKSSRILTFIISGSISGMTASLLLCPMEALRIRIVAEPEFGKENKGSWVTGFVRMLKYEGGFRGIIGKGLLPMMAKQVPYTVTKQGTFDIITSFLYSLLISGGYTINHKMKFLIPFISAMIASMLSVISSHPGDTLLSLVNAHEGNKTTSDFTKEIIKKDGMKGFFVGMRARFLHVGIIVTSQLLIYDYVKRLCGIGATGLN